MLSEFTLRSVNPKRRLLHALLTFLPEARTYARSIKVGHSAHCGHCGDWTAARMPCMPAAGFCAGQQLRGSTSSFPV